MADISKITLPNGSSYDFKDSVARSGLAGKAASSHTHTKSQITDFPSSLPANGGNADTAGLIKPTLIGTDESCAYKTILDWANSVDGMGQAHTLVAVGYPSDTPVGDEGMLTVETDFENRRKVVTFKSYGSGRGTYRRNIWDGGWRWDWVDIAEKPYVKGTGTVPAHSSFCDVNLGFMPSLVLFWTKDRSVTVASQWSDKYFNTGILVSEDSTSYVVDYIAFK